MTRRAPHSTELASPDPGLAAQTACR
jgi:hypothetical protein